MDLGYARVSTAHQDLERQLVALGEHRIPDGLCSHEPLLAWAKRGGRWG